MELCIFAIKNRWNKKTSICCDEIIADKNDWSRTIESRIVYKATEWWQSCERQRMSNLQTHPEFGECLPLSIDITKSDEITTFDISRDKQFSIYYVKDCVINRVHYACVLEISSVRASSLGIAATVRNTLFSFVITLLGWTFIISHDERLAWLVIFLYHSLVLSVLLQIASCFYSTSRSNC